MSQVVVPFGKGTVSIEEPRHEVSVTESNTVVEIALSGTPKSSIELQVPFAYPGPLVVTQGQMPFPVRTPMVLLGVTAAVGSAPIGADIIVDLNVDGASVFAAADRPRVLNGTTIGAEATTFLNANVASGSVITADIDQVGSSDPGAELAVTLRYRLL